MELDTCIGKCKCLHVHFVGMYLTKKLRILFLQNIENHQPLNCHLFSMGKFSVVHMSKATFSQDLFKIIVTSIIS